MNKKDLANAILASAVSDSATSATLVSGYGATMPAVPFKLTVTPFGQLSTMGNSEIWLVTARSTDTLTITRAQNGTTAKTFAAGDIVSNGVYVEDVIGGNNVITGETPSGTIDGSNKVFTLSQSYVANSTAVFVNGLMQRRGTDYVETTPGSGIITFDEAPLTGGNVRISYQNATSSSGNADTVDGFHAAATPTANTIPVLDASSKIPNSVLPQYTRTTDANGWLVTDWGGFKEYEYKYDTSSYAISSGDTDNTLTTVSMPVGVTIEEGQCDIIMRGWWANTSWGGLDLVAIRTIPSGSTILVRLHTRTTSANNIQMRITLRVRV